MLASGSQEREPRICHHRCQDFSTRQSCSSSLLGGNLLNTSSPTSVPMGRAWSKCGIQKGSSLSTETFGAEIRRPGRCGFCDSRSSQGPSLAQFEINRKFARVHNPDDDRMEAGPDIYDNYKRQVNAYGELDLLDQRKHQVT